MREHTAQLHVLGMLVCELIVRCEVQQNRLAFS